MAASTMAHEYPFRLIWLGIRLRGCCVLLRRLLFVRTTGINGAGEKKYQRN